MSNQPTPTTDSTLAWNPRRKRIEGTYKGRAMTAGRGSAYQFQIGATVYTAYWTGLLRFGDPIFRQVDTDQELSARHADWFMPLAEVCA